MPKSPDAFRTISEVAEWLGLQAHVLRFWESKFAQVKPIKRAGGRRYYRPTDMLLLGGLKKLLHEDGLTIKGAQKLLREKGVSYVADMSQPLDDLTAAVIEGQVLGPDTEIAVPAGEPVEPATRAFEPSADPGPPTAQVSAETPPTADQIVTETAPDLTDVEEDASVASSATEEMAPPDPTEDTDSAESPGTAVEDAEESVAVMPSFRARPRPASAQPQASEADVAEPPPLTDAPAPSEEPDAASAPAEEMLPEQSDDLAEEHAQITPVSEAADAQDSDAQDDMHATSVGIEEPVANDSEPLKPKVIELAPVPAYTEIDATPAALAALSRLRQVTPEQAHQIKPLLARLTRLRASMARHDAELRKED